ncbi:MAG: hypothetical protein AAFO69_15465 [Bacteroidota bacterium]
MIQKGLIALENQQYEDAYDFFDGVLVRLKVFEDQKVQNDAMLGIASVLFYQNKVDDCIQAIEYVEKNTKEVGALAIIGQLYYGLEMYKESAKSYQNALSAEPCNVAFQNQVIDLYTNHLKSNQWLKKVKKYQTDCENNGR